jgi:hypothetical protein
MRIKAWGAGSDVPERHMLLVADAVKSLVSLHAYLHVQNASHALRDKQCCVYMSSAIKRQNPAASVLSLHVLLSIHLPAAAGVHWAWPCQLQPHAWPRAPHQGRAAGLAAAPA